MYQNNTSYYLTPSRSPSPSYSSYSNSSEDDVYQILTPYPQYSGQTEGVDPSILAYLCNQHEILADGAVFDELHANPWLVTGKQDKTPPVNEWAQTKVMVQLEDGTWERREQSPEPLYEIGSDDEEILLLDGDIMERDLDTGFIGECGMIGCRLKVGCEECKGKRPANVTPRTNFRQVIDQETQGQKQMQKSVPSAHKVSTGCATIPRPSSRPLNTEPAYPKHLQRLANNSTIIAYTSAVPTKVPTPNKKGPKIKYVRKRVAPPMERVRVGGHKKKRC